MAVAVDKNLIPGEAFDIARFTYKSLSVVPGAAGDYTIQVSNDGSTWFPIAANVTANTFLRSGTASGDLPLCAQKIRVVENAAGASPVFAFLGHDPA